MSLLVSIHDVTPAHAAPCRELWELCARFDLRPALLVVPDWHGAWPLESHPSFVAWVRSRAEEGAEIVLHGERHDEVGTTRSARDGARAWGRTDREGEFLTLGYDEARARIDRGLIRLRALGLEPSGFIAPAWLCREATYRAAADAGLAFAEDARTVRRLHDGASIPSPVVRWSARTSVRAWGSAVVAVGRWRFQRRSAVIRIALHPTDLAHRATRRSLTRALDAWSHARRSGRYADLVA